MLNFLDNLANCLQTYPSTARLFYFIYFQSALPPSTKEHSAFITALPIFSSVQLCLSQHIIPNLSSGLLLVPSLMYSEFVKQNILLFRMFVICLLFISCRRRNDLNVSELQYVRLRLKQVIAGQLLYFCLVAGLK